MPIRLFLLLCCLTLGTFPQASPVLAQSALPAFDTYSNTKYGYFIDYPRGVFYPQGESDAGDGQVFRSPDNQAELRVFANFNVLDETLAAKFQESLVQPGLKPTYQVLRKNWFVVSGFWGGKVFYQKTFQARDAFYTVMLVYNPANKAAYDPLVGPIVKSFRIE